VIAAERTSSRSPGSCNCNCNCNCNGRYTTTDNHPTTVRIARKPARGAAAIVLDPRTGLPMGTRLSAEEERVCHAEGLRRAAGAGGGVGASDDDDDEGYGREGAVNAGAARPKKEGAEEKRQRKAAARANKAERRQEKKGSKEAFREERAVQLATRLKTAQLPCTSLSRWGN